MDRLGQAAGLRVGLKRDLHSYWGTAPWFAFECERPAQLKDAFSHIDNPETSGFANLVWGATNAIVRNTEVMTLQEESKASW